MSGFLEITFSFQRLDLGQGVQVQVLQGRPLLAWGRIPNEVRTFFVL